MDNPILEFKSICKSFGPVQVLKNVSFRINRGTVHAVCGENGAGKSTLMKVLAGVHAPDSGTMLLDGKEFSPSNPLDALDCGVSMIYQELDLAEHLTVTENIFLGHELQSAKCRFKLDEKRMYNETSALIKEYGFELDPDALVSSLSAGKAQVVELLKAIHRKSRVVVMDEPTSSLSEKEAKLLFEIIARLKKQGVSVIYISHRMDEIQLLADEVSVLRDGQLVKTDLKSNLPVSEIIKLMVGRELNDYYPKRNAEIGNVVFSVRNLSDGKRVHDVSFDVRAGEIVGMAGLVGAGRTETADAIFGISKRTSGYLQLFGNQLNITSPSDAIREGLGYLTEDRKRTGLCTNLSGSWNITLPNYDHIGMGTFLNLAREYRLATEFGKEVHIKWNDPDDAASRLSGGNQQKLLLARWLMAESKFLILDEPTRGIDVGAKKEVYTLLNALAESGKAILLISSELPELFGVTDRMLVMRDGRIAADLKTSETTQESVMRFAAG